MSATQGSCNPRENEAKTLIFVLIMKAPRDMQTNEKQCGRQLANMQ